MTIFIPVLWICINAHCEFMQKRDFYTSEEVCKEEVRHQKQKMRERAEQTGGEIKQLEGTCIDATVNKGLSAKVEQ
ncbi:MAG: hypothetical protein EBR90_01180 [Actinobacteria bacterium]|nr:hypothetical protein [Actinomycetota bacterium]